MAPAEFSFLHGIGFPRVQNTCSPVYNKAVIMRSATVLIIGRLSHLSGEVFFHPQKTHFKKPVAYVTDEKSKQRSSEGGKQGGWKLRHVRNGPAGEPGADQQVEWPMENIGTVGDHPKKTQKGKA